MQTEMSIDVERPIEDVFEALNDHVAEWSLTVVEDELLEETPERVGSRFRMVTEERGRQMEFRGRVTHWEPPRASAVHLAGDAFDIDVGYRFEERNGGTRVTQTSRVTGKGFFKVLFGLFGWMMKRAGCDAQRKELESMKRFCEGRAG